MSMSSAITESRSSRDRVKGILIGLAAGDRNGGPIRMAVQLAENLAALVCFDPQAILQRYLTWWQTEGFDTGPVAAGVFNLIGAGVAPADASAQVHAANNGLTAGCNPADRSAPLAMAAFLPDAHLAKYAQTEAALTHWHPLAGDVAAATTVLCRALVQGCTWPTALQMAQADRTAPTVTALSSASDTPVHRDGFAPHVLQAAVHFVHTHHELTAALDAALLFAGPANYCPVLVGAIGGARWGAAHIEMRHLNHCTIVSQVQAIAEKLALPWAE